MSECQVNYLGFVILKKTVREEREARRDAASLFVFLGWVELRTKAGPSAASR